MGSMRSWWVCKNIARKGDATQPCGLKRAEQMVKWPNGQMKKGKWRE